MTVMQTVQRCHEIATSLMSSHRQSGQDVVVPQLQPRLSGNLQPHGHCWMGTNLNYHINALPWACGIYRVVHIPPSEFARALGTTHMHHLTYSCIVEAHALTRCSSVINKTAWCVLVPDWSVLWHILV